MNRFHEVVMGVYFDDLDVFGVLHNARYLLLIERTLGSFWELVGVGGLMAPEAVRARGDHWHLVRSNRIEYLRPVRGPGRVRVRVWVAKIGTTSLVFGTSVSPVDSDAEFATGERVVVCVDPNSGRPVPWSEPFRARMEPWLPQLS